MTTAAVDIGTLIVTTPGIVGGRPRIDGTRMPVSILAGYWQRGYSADDMVNRAFPELTLAQVHAALAYYLSNREAIDHENIEDEASYCEGAAASLRQGDGPPSLTDAEREAKAAELEQSAVLLRQRLR